MKRVVVISGAGISDESGLKTFRGADGFSRGYRPEEVASPEAWRRDPGLVLDFYDERRRVVREAEPNAAHLALVDLERGFDVRIVTQHVDDLHERAGSSRVLHLHGEIRQARSTKNPALVTHLGDGDIHLGDRCALGSQLRPSVIVAELGAKGIRVFAAQVSAILKKMGFRPLRKRRKKSAAGAAAGAPKAVAGKIGANGSTGAASIDDLFAAKKAVATLGGSARALEVIQALKRLEE